MRFRAAVVALAIACAQAAPAAAAPQPALSPTVYAVKINGVKVDDGAIVLAARDGSLYVRESDLALWHVRVPTAPATVDYGGSTYVPLSAVNAVGLHVDGAKAEIAFALPVQSFARTVSDARYVSHNPAQHGVGAFLNYQLYAARYFGQTSVSGAFENGIAFESGVLRNSFNLAANGANPFSRMTSTFERDDVGRMRTVRLGDFVSRSDDAGRSVNLAGISIGTDYSLDPSFVWYPGVSVAGTAAVPSSLDLFVNNVRQLHKNVDAGAYEITNLPVVDGSGNVTVLVTDATGAHHFETVPYYFTRDLLKPGVSDYSVSAGFLHTGYDGFGSYGPGVVVAQERVGLSRAFTGGVHVETGGRRSLLALTSDFLASRFGNVSAALGESFGSLGHGDLVHVAWSYESTRLRLGAVWESRQSGYRAADSLGIAGNAYAGQTEQFSAGLRVTPRAFATLTYSASNQVGTTGSNAFKFLEATLSSPSRSGEQRSVTFYRTIGQGGFGMQANVTIPVGDRKYLTETVGSTRVGQSGTELRKDLPESGIGSGFDITRPWSPDGVTEMQLYNITPHGDFSVDAQLSPSQNLVEANAVGALVFAGGRVLPTRSVASAFGIVEVPGEAGVPVYVNNRFVGTTDKRGDVAVPFFAPYADNEVRIDSAKLPLDVDVADARKIVTPYDYNAAVVKYDVVKSGGVTVSLIDARGNAIPRGSSARIVGSQLTSPVAYDGTVYFSPVSPGDATLEVTMGVDGTCRAAITIPTDTTMQPNLGKVVCR